MAFSLRTFPVIRTLALKPRQIRVRDIWRIDGLAIMLDQFASSGSIHQARRSAMSSKITGGQPHPLMP